MTSIILLCVLAQDWIEKLSDDDPVVRAQAQEALMKSGHEVLGRLEHYRNDPDAEMRVRAETICRFHRTLQTEVANLRPDSVRGNACAAARTLMRLANEYPAARVHLAGLLSDGTPQTEFFAAYVMIGAGHREWIEAERPDAYEHFVSVFCREDLKEVEWVAGHVLRALTKGRTQAKVDEAFDKALKPMAKQERLKPLRRYHQMLWDAIFHSPSFPKDARSRLQQQNLVFPAPLVQTAIENLRDDDIPRNATVAYWLLENLGDIPDGFLRNYVDDSDAQLRGYVRRLLKR